ncbi:MAG: hypothetical protein LCH53_06095 [Bacteroidetes bacterium]|nr:hypothetical protein [Bacteroidota bacterium]
MSANEKRIRRAFTYHPPTENQVLRFQTLREDAADFARVLDIVCPEGREKALALTKLEEVVMWANAAVAREDK